MVRQGPAGGGFRSKARSIAATSTRSLCFRSTRAARNTVDSGKFIERRREAGFNPDTIAISSNDAFTIATAKDLQDNYLLGNVPNMPRLRVSDFVTDGPPIVFDSCRVIDLFEGPIAVLVDAYSGMSRNVVSDVLVPGTRGGPADGCRGRGRRSDQLVTNAGEGLGHPPLPTTTTRGRPNEAAAIYRVRLASVASRASFTAASSMVIRFPMPTVGSMT